MSAIQLRSLASEINSGEQAIEILKTQTLDKADALGCEIRLQGMRLIQAKALVAHGNWLAWLAEHCPRTGERMAQRYMAVAKHAETNPSCVTDIDRAKSLRECCSLLTNGESKLTKSKHWPAYLEAIGRSSRLARFLEANPLKDWPEEGIVKLREDLLPIAKALWCDKF